LLFIIFVFLVLLEGTSYALQSFAHSSHVLILK
jgi:hypothetical protein